MMFLLVLLAGTAYSQEFGITHPANASFRSSSDEPVELTAGMRVLVAPYLPQCVEAGRVNLDVFPLGFDRPYAGRILTPPGRCVYRLEALLPAELPLGPAEAILTMDGKAMVPAAVSIVPTRFALLQEPAFPLMRPATPGTRVRVRGAGLGTASLAQVTVAIGGVTARPLSARPIAAEPGLDEVEFEVPGNILLTGCYVPLSVSAGGQSTNTIPIAVSRTPGPCAHRLGLTAEQMRRLDDGGTIPLVRLRVSNLIIVLLGEAFASNASISSGMVGRDLIAEITGLERLPFVTGCEVKPSTLRTFSFEPAREASTNPEPLELGEPIAITNPQGRQISLHNFSFFDVFPGIIVPFVLLRGTTFTGDSWRLTSPGSDTLPPLNWQVRVSERLDTGSFNAYTLLRDGVNSEFTWDGTRYGDKEWLEVTISVDGFSHQLECRGEARSGRLELRIADLLKVTGPIRNGQTTFDSFRLHREPRHDLFPFRLNDGTPAIGVFTNEP
ncbi:MAG: hypothetical protein JST93_13430 [Acidobacteria bacterium]|nr:hypothetical protein [Acidobacteriota bacterium]